MLGSIIDKSSTKPIVGIGLSSGTSADGIDAALVKINDSSGSIKIELLGFQKHLYPIEISILIKEIASGLKVETSMISKLNYYLGELFADAALNLIESFSSIKDDVDYIASHGQTICHHPTPEMFYGKLTMGTMQIGEPAVVAKKTGITTIADFRPDDVAAGGEGAPILPHVDYLIFSSKNSSRLIQNIGGIANLAYITKNSTHDELIAFDTGPGNMIIDQLCSFFSDGKITFDKDGELALRGKVSRSLLDKLLDNEFFKRKPPKSCGRLYFGKNYTENLIAEGKKLGLC
ncbi:anhydro-N-acetylmuramic acid kinase [bacterium]|nr:anhydro-N-acetylmuramic acid kinase [bacterium]